MTYILLNKTNFDKDWASESLYETLHGLTNIVIMPLAYNDGWSSDAMLWNDRFERGSSYYYDIVRPFKAYGIKENGIQWIDFYQDDYTTIEMKLKKAQLLCIIGHDAYQCMERIEDLGINSLIRNFKGDVIGISAGAQILLSQFYRLADEEMDFSYIDGVGALSNFYLDTHYYEDIYHLGGIIRVLEETNYPVIIMPDRGGVMISEGSLELLGDAFIADENDLDEIYQLYREVYD